MGMRQETVYMAWMEWDYGQDQQAFATPDLAWKWIEKTGVAGDMDESLDALVDQGLIRVDSLQVVYRV